MRILLIVLLAIIPSFIFAQNDSTRVGSISGTVKDSAGDYALQSVTITLYKNADSSLVNYKITGEDGVFNFGDIPFNMPVDIHFTFAGYNPFSKTITLDTLNRNFNFKNVLLARSEGMLDEVVVKAVQPITMNGDTLEINPAAFRLDSNAVVEDMLRRVPGVTMWGDGTITVNGQRVNNVYVDGKPFFGNDPTLATQNLPKNAIDKIQVYRETDYTLDDVDQNPADSMLTMNIQLRADKRKGFFGKVGAGVGTDSRYEGDGSALAYNQKLRGGIAASINNINKTAGLQEMLQQGTYRNYNPNNRYVANFGNAGVNKVLFLGGNVQYDFSDNNTSRFNNQLRANYDFRNTNNFVSSQTDSRNSASGVVILENRDQTSNSISNNHSGGIGYNKRDQDKDFSINANFTTSDNTRSSSNHTTRAKEEEGVVSESNSVSSSRSNSTGGSLSTSFRNKDDDERNLKSFGLNYNLSYNKSESESKSITDAVYFDNSRENDYYNRLNNNNSSNFNTGLGLNYNALKRLLFGNFALWNINMVLSNNLSFSRNEGNTRVSDYDSLTGRYFVNDSLTHNNTVTRIIDRPSLRLSKRFEKRLSDRFNRYINLSANMQGQILTEKNESSFDYRNMNRSFQFFTPTASIQYNYRKFNFYTIDASLTGNTSPSIPSIDQLRPIIDTSENVYNINLGNPNLKPSKTNEFNLNLNYRREGSQRKTDFNFGLNASASKIKSAIVDSSYFDQVTTRRTLYLINMDGRKVYSAGFNGGASFKLKQNKVLQFNYSLEYTNTTSPNYIDGIYTVTEANNIRNSLRAFYTLGEIGTVQVSQSINNSSSNQTGGRLSSLKTINYVTQGNLNITPIKDFTISNTLNYVTNNTTKQSSALWNAFASYRFLPSKQAEVKFSAMDILKQNKNISTNVGLNNLSTTVTNGLEQFFMLTFSYYPRQFGGGRSRGGRRSVGSIESGGGTEQRSIERRGNSGGNNGRSGAGGRGGGGNFGGGGGRGGGRGN